MNYARTIRNPVKGKKNREHQILPKRNVSTRKLGERRRKSARKSPKTQEKGKERIIECSGDAEISYSRRCLEICRRYAEAPVAHALAKYLCRHRKPLAAPVEAVRRAGERGSLISPGSSKNLNQTYPIRRCSRADFPKPPQTVVVLAPKVSPVGKHGVAVPA